MITPGVPNSRSARIDVRNACPVCRIVTVTSSGLMNRSGWLTSRYSACAAFDPVESASACALTWEMRLSAVSAAARTTRNASRTTIATSIRISVPSISGNGIPDMPMPWNGKPKVLPGNWLRGRWRSRISSNLPARSRIAPFGSSCQALRILRDASPSRSSCLMILTTAACSKALSSSQSKTVGSRSLGRAARAVASSADSGLASRRSTVAMSRSTSSRPRGPKARSVSMRSGSKSSFGEGSGGVSGTGFACRSSSVSEIRNSSAERVLAALLASGPQCATAQAELAEEPKIVGRVRLFQSLHDGRRQLGRGPIDQRHEPEGIRQP